MAAASVSATIVAYQTDARILECALRSLACAVQEARAAGLLGTMTLFLVDNSPAPFRGQAASALAAWPAAAGSASLISGHGNVGYGRANNLVLQRLQSDLHLVMNPDIELEPDVLIEAVRVLDTHPDVRVIAPAVRGTDGTLQYLCKRYPTIWVLFLRSFAPASLRDRFRGAVDTYEMRDLVGEEFLPGVQLASGAFMLLRTAAFIRAGGFDGRYFMYFEDYDLSIRVGGVAYVPKARIVHHGGHASRKGLRHVAWFVASAWRFFSRHGWRIV